MSNAANLQGHYGNLIDGWLKRWKRAATEARNGTYTADRLAADATASFFDGADWWSYPWAAVMEDRTPVVHFSVAAAAVAEIEAITIPDPGPGNVEVTSLTSTKPGSPTIAKNTHVTAKLSPDRRTLGVFLKSLDTLTPRLSAGEQYTGQVEFGPKSDRIATILVDVT